MAVGIPGSAAINILVGVNFKSIWDSINVLNFLIYTRSWVVSTPSNFETFIGLTSYFARGEFLPKKQILDSFRMINQDDDPQARMTKFYFWIAIILSILLAFAGILVWLFHRCKDNVVVVKILQFAKSVVTGTFWNGILRLAI